MHLKAYPNLQKSELHLEPRPDSQRSGLHLRHQGTMRTEWGLRPACARKGSSTTSTPSGGRCPLAVISTNTLRGTPSTTANHNIGSSSRLSGDFHSARSRKTKSSSSSSSQGTFTTPSSLLLFSPDWDSKDSLSLFQAQVREGDGPIDIWTVIKPGNTKEKIAIFALPQRLQHGGRTNGDEGSSGGGGGGEGNCDGGEESEPMQDMEDSGPVPGGLSPAVRVVSMKAKGCWEGECLVAKRRRRSTHHHHHTLQERDGLPEPRAQASLESSPGQEQLSQPPQVPESGEEQDCRVELEEDEEDEAEEGEGEGEGKSPSVVEMVAFLEQRASNQQVDSKPVSLRSSTTITLSKAHLALELLPRDGPDEEGESVRVSDMVAKLESECLKRQSLREGGVGGELSRNNSLRRRAVGRVLLAGADACAATSQLPSPPPTHPQDQTQTTVSSPESPVKCTETEAVLRASPALLSPSVDPVTVESSLKAEGLEDQTEGLSEEAGLLIQTQNQVNLDTSRQCEQEPLPGMLFFSLPPLSEQQTLPSSHTYKHTQAQTHTGPPMDTEPNPRHNPEPEHFALYPCLTSPPASPLLPCPPSVTHCSHTEEERVSEGGPTGEEVEEEESSGTRERVHFPLRRMVSHEFLEVRFKIQLLLEPQQYLAFLPHHILLQIFSLLPTQALAALKCSCHYFKFIIESYGVRPADSRWVCDPRYRDDPCKQCKRRYGRGDVSLCRWHHKPYCQAMPYGPGYWMCCHGTLRDTPGCNVGLHDNRWVPAFHSINMPIYRE